MSEGPEVKITADKIRKALENGITIKDIISKKIDKETKDKIIGSSVEYIETYGKNIVIKFSTGIYLRNHMMMWGKWRIYERIEYDKGLARPPPSRKSSFWKTNMVKENIMSKIENKQKDVRYDPRVRLIIITDEKALIQFNGPILQFSIDNPASREPIRSLGPDGLSEDFDKNKVILNLKSKTIKKTNNLKADALLDQQIVSGIGNKYKSELLFINHIYPFKKVMSMSEEEIDRLVSDIPRVLEIGYKNKGKTRPVIQDEKISWNTIHWVFRRTGKPCWVCGFRISSEKKITPRSTYWCQKCQPITS